MSIATYSVVGRILAEVQKAAPVAPLARLSTVWQVAEAEQVLELRRTSRIHEPPFATSFHFWAHALWAFLEGQGRLDLFEALANHGLCEHAEAEVVMREFDALTRRMSTQVFSPGDAERFRFGYRMLDQPVVASWVAESDDEQTAVFWARSAWLAVAHPVDFDESPRV